MQPIRLKEKFDSFQETWSPKIVGELNGQYVKLAKCKGRLVWHRHEDQDEFFMVIKGEFGIELRDRTVILKQGDCFIVPKMVEHSPFADEEAHVMVFEPKGTAHTGDVQSDMTVPEEDQNWI